MSIGVSLTPVLLNSWEHPSFSDWSFIAEKTETTEKVKTEESKNDKSTDDK